MDSLESGLLLGSRHARRTRHPVGRGRFRRQRRTGRFDGGGVEFDFAYAAELERLDDGIDDVLPLSARKVAKAVSAGSEADAVDAGIDGCAEQRGRRDACEGDLTEVSSGIHPMLSLCHDLAGSLLCCDADGQASAANCAPRGQSARLLTVCASPLVSLYFSAVAMACLAAVTVPTVVWGATLSCASRALRDVAGDSFGCLYSRPVRESDDRLFRRLFVARVRGDGLARREGTAGRAGPAQRMWAPPVRACLRLINRCGRFFTTMARLQTPTSTAPGRRWTMRAAWTPDSAVWCWPRRTASTISARRGLGSCWDR